MVAGTHHECTIPAAELSRHVDMDCLRDNADTINDTPDTDTSDTEEADS